MASQALSKDDIMAQAASARGQGRSQATVVEQSRAIAEVQGALLVADRRPRDEQDSLAQALESCRTQDVAQGAFFKFPRGGQTVAGASIHLARELARCWGNIVYAIVELDRDDDRHLSEMMAYAWDLETNARAQLQFLVPHKRDKRGGAEVLTDMRDIYENNANMGARRLRECIFAVLPPYLTKAAERTCHETLQGNKDEKPLPVRINEAIAAFENIGISKDRIEAKLGPSSRFTPVDLANLRVSFGSIQRGEISADDEFPRTDGLTREQLLGDQTKKGPEPAAKDETELSQDEYREGRDDADMGEGFVDENPSEYETAPEDLIANIKGQIAAAKNLKGLQAVEAEWLNKHRIGCDPDQIDYVESLISAKREGLAG